MTYSQYILALEILKRAIEGRIIAVIPEMEDFAYKALLTWIDKSLEMRRGNLIASEETVAILNDFDSSFMRVLNSMKSYKGAVTEMIKELPWVEKLMKEFQESSNKINWAAANIQPTQKLIINEVINAYTENGLNKNFVQPLRDMMYQNIMAGSNVTQVKEQLEKYVKGEGEKAGKLKSYITHTAQQAVDGYTGAINKKLMDAFDYKYLQMSGSLIETSTPQCRKGINEFEGVITREVWAELEPIAEKNGIVEGTTFENITFNKFHWGCRHEFTPMMTNNEQ